MIHPEASNNVPGGEAERPQQIPRRGWVQIARRGWAESKSDQVPLLAAGVAFFAFLALFPAMIGMVLIYGLVADPDQISTQIGSLTAALPTQVRALITDQLTALSANSGAAGLGAIVSIFVALWSASGGVNNLVTAINTAYDEQDTRSFIRKRALALLLTIGAIVVMIVMLFLVAAIPAVVGEVDEAVIQLVIQVVRWVLLVAVISVALAILYRVAPHRDAPKMRWVSVGAVVATVLWVIASVGFSVYVDNFGSYAKTYGALASVVILLLWLWITCYAILLGAEINAESEQQTIADTTRGQPQPLGRRDAVKADSIPDDEAKRPD